MGQQMRVIDAFEMRPCVVADQAVASGTERDTTDPAADHAEFLRRQLFADAADRDPAAADQAQANPDPCLLASVERTTAHTNGFAVW